LAGVCLRASVAVVARRAIGLVWIRAGARAGVAGADVVALVLSGAGFGIGARASAALAGVCLGAGVAVVACRAVGLGRADTNQAREAARAALVGASRVAAHAADAVA
jgi:hypothetical protein